ncbi:MAG: DUF1800 domain-containing protein [Chitinophagaceae bacterium]
MDRREFLTTRPKIQKISERTKRISLAATGIQPYTGTFGTPQLVHLLKRSMFGAAPLDINFFRGKSLDETVDYLLNPTAPMPDPPIKEYVSDGALNPDTGIAAGTTWVNDYNVDGSITSRRKASLKKWWTGQMINQDRSIREKLTLFWVNHFSIELDTVNDSQFVYKMQTLLRANSTGNFKTLTRAVTVDPAMLIYLNGSGSKSSAPNENYGRELQELFTLGKENNPNYSEVDVKVAARALTGWTASSATISATFSLANHDKLAKVYSAFYNHTTAANATSTAGDDDITDLINMIFSKKEEVSQFIVTKLYRWFCYYDVDDNIKANVIVPLAKVFADSNWDIKTVMAALLKSEHFYDENIKGSLIKSPVDITISMCREFNMVFPLVASGYDNAYAMFEYIRALTVPMGQNIGDPINVAGWEAYYQAPQYHEIWMNADSLPRRNKFTDLFSNNGYTRNSFVLKIDAVGFTKNLSSPGNPNQLLADAIEILFQVPLSDSFKQTIKQTILLSGQITDSYWTDAWNAYLANPMVTGTPYKMVDTRLRTLYKYLMNLPEYQLS